MKNSKPAIPFSFFLYLWNMSKMPFSAKKLKFFEKLKNALCWRWKSAFGVRWMADYIKKWCPLLWKHHSTYLLVVFAISATALLVSVIVWIHLIGAIVVIFSIRRIIWIVLICVITQLTTGMGISGHAFSFAHNMISFLLIVFFIGKI